MALPDDAALPFSLLHLSRVDVADRELAKALLRAVVSVIETPVGQSLFRSHFKEIPRPIDTQSLHALSPFTSPISLLANHLLVSIVAPPRAQDQSATLQPLSSDALSTALTASSSSAYLSAITGTRTQESLAASGTLWTAYPPASLALIEQALVALAPYAHPLLVLDIALTALSLGGLGADGILTPVGNSDTATFSATLPAKTTFDLAAAANDVHIGCGVFVTPAGANTTPARVRCSPLVCINMPIPIKCALKMVAASVGAFHALGVRAETAALQTGRAIQTPLMRLLNSMAVLMRVSVALLSNPNAIVRKEAVQTLVSLEPMVSRDVCDILLSELSAPQMKLFEIYKAKATTPSS